MKILIATSSRDPVYETSDIDAIYARVCYSLGAIAYNLVHSCGCEVRTCGFKTSISFGKLKHLIDDFQPDIVYTHGAIGALLPIKIRHCSSGWRKFQVVHGWDDLYDDIWGKKLGWFGRITMGLLQKRIVTQSDAVVVLSRYQANLSKSRWGVDCHYIPNGADLVDRNQIATGKIKLEGRFNIVYTGDQAKWKRTYEVCEAMRHLPKDIKLYLTGRHYAYLDKYASENCVFLGFVSKEEQLSIMNQADCFVCTSDQDCNAKIQEYLRFEKPYLGYDGRANLFFKNRHNAYLTKDYVAAVTELANNPDLCRELSDHAAKEIPIYSWAEIAEQFAAYFNEITGGLK